VPLPAPLPADVLSAWVEVVGPWTGAVVITMGRRAAAELTRCLLGAHAPEVLEEEDVVDALGEMANVVGGNVKGVLPAPSVLGLPEVGQAPVPADPAHVVRVEALWRGHPLSISVQGAPAPAVCPDPHEHRSAAVKILVADDSRVMRQIVIRTLRQAGYDDHEIVEAEDGADALAKVSSEKPDLVLSDWNMPNMTGIECLQALRSSGSAVPFGFVTSEGSPEMREKASNAGALFLIAKPFNEDTFKDALDGVIA
jgi:two-component system chemotaxis response regulator CheY